VTGFRVCSLVENTAERAGLLGEHGLAMWIECARRHVLFDTGQGLALLHNAKELGIDLQKADAIVLSHGHYDHTGGLVDALELARQAKLYAHPEAFERRFVRDDDGSSREVGIRDADADAVRGRGAEVVETLKPTEICEGLFVTGPVPRMTDYETTNGSFFLDSDFRRRDPLNDDQAMFFECDKGVVVLLGCAHAGVVNTLTYVQHITSGKPIHAVIGGMHLRRASRQRIDRTLAAMREMNIACLRPAHCTGMRAVAGMWRLFPECCSTWSVGSRLEFQRRNPI
jgi:7,8-dihydropterin-6-yl-methyl-4-(beta-D-ribofuranosyl)aminobenzene 5'-phosphate synthase